MDSARSTFRARSQATPTTSTPAAAAPSTAPAKAAGDVPITIAGDLPVGLTAEELAVVVDMRTRAASQQDLAKRIASSVAADLLPPAPPPDPEPAEATSAPPSTSASLAPPAGGAPGAGEARARNLTLYKENKAQKVGIRFFSAAEARQRGVENICTAIVAMIAEDGPLHGKLRRGERIATIGGTPISSPSQAALTLLESEGYVRLGVLPPPPEMDLEVKQTEMKPMATPRGSAAASTAADEAAVYSTMGAQYNPDTSSTREPSVPPLNMARARVGDLGTASPASPRSLSARAKAVLDSPRRMAADVKEKVNNSQLMFVMRAVADAKALASMG